MTRRRVAMAEVRQLSFEEKYLMARDAEERTRKVIIPFAEEHLGERPIITLKRRWEAAIKLIPRDATPEQQYEIAYENWISTLQTSYDLVREIMGEPGVEELKARQIQALQEGDGATKVPFFFGLYKALAPGAAFKKSASRLIEQMQWFTPFTVQELNDKRAVLEVARCRILEHERANDICDIACRQVYPSWAANEFGIALRFNRQNGGCIATLEPM